MGRQTDKDKFKGIAQRLRYIQEVQLKHHRMPNDQEMRRKLNDAISSIREVLEETYGCDVLCDLYWEGDKK